MDLTPRRLGGQAKKQLSAGVTLRIGDNYADSFSERAGALRGGDTGITDVETPRAYLPAKLSLDLASASLTLQHGRRPPLGARREV